MKNIIVLNKPKGITSHDAISLLKKKYKFKKVGHAGTLDPNASGVLVVGCNEGTKLLSKLIMDDKEYIADIKFGLGTDSYDAEGKVVFSENITIDLDLLKKAIESFNNIVYQQKPPIYSAIKINGKKLYEYARENKTVDISFREVQIKKIDFINFDKTNNLLKIKLLVSKGFYVRSFAMDLAKLFHTQGTLMDLVRTKSGNFSLEEAINI